MTAIMEKQVSAEQLTLSDDQVDMLARPLVHIVAAFFEDPENERQFQEWKRRREMEREGALA